MTYKFGAIVAVEMVVIAALTAQIFEKKGFFGADLHIMPIHASAVVSVPSEELSYFYEMKPNTVETQTFNTAQQPAHQTINADGLNERYDYSAAKPEGTFRIIAIGDSFTFGAGEDTANNYPEQLEDLLNERLRCQDIKKFEVLNLGVSGYDIEYAVERFRSRGQKYNADLVLWLVKYDDFTVVSEIVQPKIREYDMRQDSFGMDEEIRSGRVGNPSWIMAIRDAEREYGNEYFLRYEIDAMKNITDHFSGPILIFTFSTLEHAYKEAVREFSDAHEQIHFYDNLVNIYSNRENYWPDTHPTAKGYGVIAEDLLEHLKSRSLLCGPK